MRRCAESYHRLPVRLLNRLLSALQRVGLFRVDLTERGLIAAACQQTGLKDFGDEPFREPMRIALHSMEQEAGLTPLGRMLSRACLLRLLKNRLWAEDLFKRYPEILERSMPAPIVMIGLPQSGAAYLHQHCSRDDRFLHLHTWEAVNPVPWPESFDSDKEPRVCQVKSALRLLRYLSPGMMSCHSGDALAPEGELGLLQHAFSSQVFEVQAKLPLFSQWLMNQDQTAAYEYMAKLLKLISWFRQDDPTKPWLMSCPQHMQDLDSLLRVFPDAKLVFCHRDPVRAIGSTCSLAWRGLVRDTQSIDPEWVGEQWLPKSLAMVQRAMRIRQTLPPEQTMDVLYDDCKKNWLAQLARIYQFVGLPFTPAVQEKLQTSIAGAPPLAPPAYPLADFGLAREEVDHQLLFYRQRFNIPYEGWLPQAANHSLSQ